MARWVKQDHAGCPGAGFPALYAGVPIPHLGRNAVSFLPRRETLVDYLPLAGKLASRLLKACELNVRCCGICFVIQRT